MKKSGRVQVREGNRPVTHADSWMPGGTEQSAADVSREDRMVPVIL